MAVISRRRGPGCILLVPVIGVIAGSLFGLTVISLRHCIGGTAASDAIGGPAPATRIDLTEGVAATHRDRGSGRTEDARGASRLDAGSRQQEGRSPILRHVAKSAGERDARCRPDGTCDSDLTCINGVCVFATDRPGP